MRPGTHPPPSGEVIEAGGAPFEACREQRGGSTMAGGKSDEAKGRVKEAAGALTGNDALKRKGKTDQAVGKVKQKVAKVIDKAKRALR
jgi:uncharacterized protein YjbJ (UPF0337 family)